MSGTPWWKRARAGTLPTRVIGGTPIAVPPPAEPPRKPRRALYLVERVRDDERVA